MWRNPVVQRRHWQALARIGWTVVAFFAVTILVFVAFYAAPGQEFRRARLPANERSWHGYVHYLWRFVRHGDLGHSAASNEAVTTSVLRAAPVTLSLLVGGLVVALAIGLAPLLRPPARADRAIAVFAVAGISVHPVWMSLVVSWLFGSHWHVLPAQGYCGISSLGTGCNGVSHWASHMILPWLVLGLATGAYVSLPLRSLLHAELDEEYVRTARGKGVAERKLVRSHVLRNLAAPLLALSVTSLGVAFSAIVFIETIFDLPGLGALFRRSLLRHDLPVTAGVVLVMTLAILAVSLLTDLAAIALNAGDRLPDHEHVEQRGLELGVARVR